MNKPILKINIGLRWRPQGNGASIIVNSKYIAMNETMQNKQDVSKMNTNFVHIILNNSSANNNKSYLIIKIKHMMEHLHFLTRGLKNVSTEMNLTVLCYNLK